MAATGRPYSILTFRWGAVADERRTANRT